MGQLVRFDRLNADPTLAVIDTFTPRVAADVAIVVGLIALGLASIRRHPSIAFGILWFFLWLLPTNSILPRLDVANDRQLYLALIGPAWLVAYALGSLAAKRGPAIPLAAALVLAIGLGTATHRRNRVYADEIVFWEDVARKSPENGRAFNNLGYAYALASQDDAAEAALRRALALDPQDVRAAANLRLLREGALSHPPRHP
jgi:protein O-mannosyl-transferase